MDGPEPPSRARMNVAPDAVVVLRFSAVGDVLLTAPALQALKRAWPQTKIVFGVQQRLASLVQHNPNVDVVEGLRDGEGAVSFARRLRAHHPGALLDLHGKVRSRLLRTLMPGVPATVWTKRSMRQTLSVKFGMGSYRAEKPFADRYHAAVEELVGAPLPKGELRYWLGPQDQSLADEHLRRAGVSLEKPILGISPGARWETKRWPAERFGKIARRAVERGLQVVVCGSRDEAPLGEEISRQAPGTFDLSGVFDLPSLGGFISRCSAFVANDSGPMHLARALGVPTLALFGSTDPNMFTFEGHAVLFANVACSPCSFYGRSKCPQGHFDCMLQLSDEQAWSALLPLLEGGARPSVSA